jgi:hypothetical protein
MLRNNYIALRLSILSIVEALKGKWGSQRNVEKRRGTLPRVGQNVGNKRL